MAIEYTAIASRAIGCTGIGSTGFVNIKRLASEYYHSCMGNDINLHQNIIITVWGLTLKIHTALKRPCVGRSSVGLH